MNKNTPSKRIFALLMSLLLLGTQSSCGSSTTGRPFEQRESPQKPLDVLHSTAFERVAPILDRPLRDSDSSTVDFPDGVVITPGADDDDGTPSGNCTGSGCSGGGSGGGSSSAGGNSNGSSSSGNGSSSSSGPRGNDGDSSGGSGSSDRDETVSELIEKADKLRNHLEEQIQDRTEQIQGLSEETSNLLARFATEHNEAVGRIVSSGLALDPQADSADGENRTPLQAQIAKARETEQLLQKGIPGEHQTALTHLLDAAERYEKVGDGERASARLRSFETRMTILTSGSPPPSKPSQDDPPEARLRASAYDAGTGLAQTASDLDDAGLPEVADAAHDAADTLLRLSLDVGRFNPIADLSLSAMEAFTGRTLSRMLHC